MSNSVTKIDNWTKLKIFDLDMKLRGVNNHKPFAFRVAWYFGIFIRPPHFLPLIEFVAFIGFFAGAFNGILFYYIFTDFGALSVDYVFMIFQLSGTFSGLLLGMWFRHQANCLRLPSWEEYPNRDSLPCI